jgi:hypothetical protein
MDHIMYSKHTERPDYVTSEIVESGISLGDEQGLNSAISYLAGCGVPDPVIARVLTAPERRRTMGRMRCRDTRMAEEGSRFKFLV